MKYTNYLKKIGVTAALTISALITAAVPVSCRVSEDGIEVVEGDSTAPKIVDFYLEDSLNLKLVCSEKVKVSNAVIFDEDERWEAENEDVLYDETGCEINIRLKNATVAGKSYKFEGMIKDNSGNCLSFSLPFAGFNQNPAKLIINEIRTKHSTSNGALGKAEYVELFVVKGGCTAGLEIVSGNDGEDKKYCFPAIDVMQGEYITVHFRVLPEGLCIDETGDELNLSTANDSCDTARDLWIDNTESRISENDVVVLRDSGRNKIVDAVLFTGSGKTGWYYTAQKTLSAQAFEDGAWKDGSDVEFAVCSDNLTLNRTLSRLNTSELFEAFILSENKEEFSFVSGKNDWAVVSSATPGETNNLEPYVK